MRDQTNRAQGSGLTGGMSSRQHAQKVLLDAAARHRRTAERFEALAAVAGTMSGDAEAAMWELATQAIR